MTSTNPLEKLEWLFPFEGLEVGDSFFIPTLQPPQLICIINDRAKDRAIKIQAFAAEKEGHLGVRVWRIR